MSVNHLFTRRHSKSIPLSSFSEDGIDMLLKLNNQTFEEVKSVTTSAAIHEG